MANVIVNHCGFAHLHTVLQSRTDLQRRISNIKHILTRCVKHQPVYIIIV